MSKIDRAFVEEIQKTLETSRIERTISTTDTDKFCEAICSFANDMPDSRQKGYLLIGVYDDGRRSGLKATDKLLKDLSSIRSDGNILPLPVMSVSSVSLDDGDVVVIEVEPSIFPPVRYRGRTFIRVGPRRSIATVEEENVLIDRRAANFPTFDCSPCQLATLDDLDLDLFRTSYLPKAIAADVLSEDDRPIERQLESLSFYSTRYNCPTYAGLLLFGRNPTQFIFGATIQYVQFNGNDRAADVANEQEFRGNLLTVLPKIETFIETAIAKKRPVPVSLLRENTVYEYPKWPIRELVMNAVMHRDYRGNAPSRFYQYSDRLEIENPGGLYGKVTRDNFPDASDYRNPVLALAMRVMGYVNKFGRGISRVQHDLITNGNPLAVFSTELVTVFKVKVFATTEAGLVHFSDIQAAKCALTDAVFALRSNRKKDILAVFDLICANNAIRVSAIMDAISASRTSVNEHIDFMKNLGILVREGGTYGGYWKICAPQSTRNP